MPELPEVQIIVNALKKDLIGKKISKVSLFREKLRREINKSFKKDILNAKITDISRVAKYILIKLSNDKRILFHLGMTGKLTFIDAGKKVKEKHDHILIEFDDKTYLNYNDVRRFGLALTLDKNEDLPFKHGLEPLNEEFNANSLLDICKNRKNKIKVLLLNQELIAGLGNIYVCEVLFLSSIDPFRQADTLSLKECKLLVKHIKEILTKSIEKGGSSIKDYRHADGSKGSFQEEFFVYGKTGKTCKVCKNIIQKETQGGRSTFYCRGCQK